jgi:hypothetical protein
MATVHTVVYFDESRGSGPAGDCSHTERFTKFKRAQDLSSRDSSANYIPVEWTEYKE